MHPDDDAVSPKRGNRHTIRLDGYDYTQPGAYFVTVCARDRACLFGEVGDGTVRLNEMGRIVREEWFRAAALRPYVALHHDEFVVMPNDVHGIVWIVRDGGGSDPAACGCARVGLPGAAHAGQTGRGAARCAPTRPPTIGRSKSTTTPHGNVPPGSLPAIVRAFKSATTKRINHTRKTAGAVVWQSNYYEHIVRNGESLERIREYILINPLRWASDRENPRAVAPHDSDREGW